MTKKCISFLLVLCMLVSLFPGMSAFADNEPAPAEAQATDSTAAVEETADDAAAEATSEETAEAQEPAKKEVALKSVLNSDFYIEANKEAGLEGKILVDMDLLGCTGKLYLPGGVDASKLNFCWDDSSITVSVDDTVYESGNAPVPAVGEKITYKITKSYALAYVTIETFKGSENVRPVFLNIDENMGTIKAMNGDRDHETSCYGTFAIDGEEYYISMKGRGNSTWVFEKKPYNITFYKKSDFADKKVELIDGVKSKKWSILANYLDNSLLRNKLAFDLAQDMGIGLASDYVDIYMNGEYLGNYMLCPKKDYQCADDGFILENDHIDDPENPDQFVFPNIKEMPLKHNRLNVDDIGDDAVDAGWDVNKIEEWFTEAWNTVLDTNSEEYLKYFDLDSWAKMYLMFEVSKTYDCYAGNIIMHRDGIEEGDLLYAGPAWDYDIAFGRTLHKFLVGMEESVQINAEGWYNDAVGFLAVSEPYSVLQGLGMHESFMKRVTELYNEYKSDFEDLSTDVDALAEYVHDSALMDNARWGANHLCADYLISSEIMHAFGTGSYRLNYEVTTKWENYVNNLKEFCAKRVMWMSDHMAAVAPVGEIVQSLNNDTGAVELKVKLTAGNNGNTYQWQSSKNGKTWSNIDGATASKLVVEYNDGNEKLMYRCLVSNEGVDIYTRHCGHTKAYAQTVLEPVTLNVTKTVKTVQLTELEDGTFEFKLDGKSMGEFTLASSGSGWTLCNDNGKYLTASGTEIKLSSSPFVWNYDNGMFSASVKVSKTKIGKWLGIGQTKTAYLTLDGGAFALSLDGGAQAAFFDTVEVYN